MASANAPLEFTGEQQQAIKKLSGLMKGAAAVLILLGLLSLGGGVWTLFMVSLVGILYIVAGGVLALLGLILLSSSADVRYMGETKYASIHLGNAFQNLTVYFQTKFYLTLFLTLIALIAVCRAIVVF